MVIFAHITSKVAGMSLIFPDLSKSISLILGILVMGQTCLVDYGGIAKILWTSAGDVAVQKIRVELMFRSDNLQNIEFRRRVNV